MKDQVLSVSQCRELISLGLNMENASMCWIIEENGEHQLTFNRPICDKELLPTFTLQDILEMLPKSIIHSNKQLKTCNYKLCTFDNKVMYTFNSFDQCYYILGMYKS